MVFNVTAACIFLKLWTQKYYFKLVVDVPYGVKFCFYFYYDKFQVPNIWLNILELTSALRQQRRARSRFFVGVAALGTQFY